MFDFFLSTPWLYLPCFIYLLILFITVMYGLYTRQYWFIVRIAIGLSLAGLIFSLGAYMQAHETIPDIFLLHHILPNHPFTVVALYGFTISIMLLVLVSIFDMFAQLVKHIRGNGKRSL